MKNPLPIDDADTVERLDRFPGANCTTALARQRGGRPFLSKGMDSDICW
jgi:hypothetical protein